MISTQRHTVARTGNAFVPLGAVAKHIANGTKPIAGSITTLDAELSRMQIASERWVTCKRSTYGQFSMTWDLGYACLDGRWGITLRVVRSDGADATDRSVESWPFEQSPPYLRRRAVTQLPNLLDALARSA